MHHPPTVYTRMRRTSVPICLFCEEAYCTTSFVLFGSVFILGLSGRHSFSLDMWVAGAPSRSRSEGTILDAIKVFVDRNSKADDGLLIHLFLNNKYASECNRWIDWTGACLLGLVL